MRQMSSAFIFLSFACVWSGKPIRYSHTGKRASQNILDTITHGTRKEIQDISRDVIIKNLWVLERLQIENYRQSVIWDIVKGDTSPSRISLETLKSLGGIIFAMPEDDLYYLDFTNWDLIEFFGTLRGLTHRQTAIIAYALQNQWGSKLLLKAEYINRLRGLICGFSTLAISSIPAEQFLHINEDVFGYITSCDIQRMQLLYEMAKAPKCYGNPSAWSRYDMKRLGLVLSGMSKDDLQMIKPSVVSDITRTTMQYLDLATLGWFSPAQVASLNPAARNVYYRKLGIKSGSPRWWWCRYVGFMFSLSFFVKNYFLV